MVILLPLNHLCTHFTGTYFFWQFQVPNTQSDFPLQSIERKTFLCPIFSLATFSFITRSLSDVQALNNREQINNNTRTHTHLLFLFPYCVYVSRRTGDSSRPTVDSTNEMWMNMQYSWNAEWRGKYKWIFSAKLLFPRPIPVPEILHLMPRDRIQFSTMRSR
jgi:hypothetical protein